MFPRLFSFDTPSFLRGFLPDQVSVYSYGFFIALGILAAYFFLYRRVAVFGMDSDKLASLMIWIIAASFVGGRVFFYFEDFGHYLAHPGDMFKFSGGGFVFYGSLLFAVPVLIWRLRVQKVPVRPFLDLVAFAGPIVHSFGRLGCFMAGCCYGKTCDNALGITFTHPDSLARPLNTPLYPTQLFDIAVNLIILAVLFSLRNRKRFSGQLFLLYICLYAVGRSVVEIFRGDEARGFVMETAISHSQFIAIILLILCSMVWIRWKRTVTTR